MILRLMGIVLGFGAHALLGVTIWSIFPFFMGHAATNESAASGWWWVDSLLVVQFGVLHSLLLYPVTRNRLERTIPAPLYGCFFTLTTCASLLLLVFGWQAHPAVVWEANGRPRWLIHAGYVLSWIGLFYSLGLTGYGFQTGWTPFRAWLRRDKPPRRVFATHGAYRLLRHPVYLSFLGLVWFTPWMTLDRALLTGLMTVYIFLGSYLKDRRLLFFVGDAYREYQARVPGYPLAVGPLGRVKAVAKPVPQHVGP